LVIFELLTDECFSFSGISFEQVVYRVRLLQSGIVLGALQVDT